MLWYMVPQFHHFVKYPSMMDNGALCELGTLSWEISYPLNDIIEKVSPVLFKKKKKKGSVCTDSPAI